MVSVLVFYSDNLSTNPADVYSFFFKFVFEKSKNKQKEAAIGPFLKTFNIYWVQKGTHD